MPIKQQEFTVIEFGYGDIVADISVEEMIITFHQTRETGLIGRRAEREISIDRSVAMTLHNVDGLLWFLMELTEVANGRRENYYEILPGKFAMDFTGPNGMDGLKQVIRFVSAFYLKATRPTTFYLIPEKDPAHE